MMLKATAAVNMGRALMGAAQQANQTETAHTVFVFQNGEIADFFKHNEKTVVYDDDKDIVVTPD